MSESQNNSKQNLSNQQQNRSYAQPNQKPNPQYHYPKASQAYYPSSESGSQTRQFQTSQQQYPYQQYPPQQYPNMQQQPYPNMNMQQQQSFQQPPTAVPGMPVTPQPTQAPAAGTQAQGMLPVERSYIENILRLNQGKRARVHMRFEQGGKEGNVRVFDGIVQAAGRDHLVLSDPESGRWYLLLMIYLDYVEFPEEINYQYLNPYAYTPSLSAYYGR